MGHRGLTGAKTSGMVWDGNVNGIGSWCTLDGNLLMMLMMCLHAFGYELHLHRAVFMAWNERWQEWAWSQILDIENKWLLRLFFSVSD
jgi:hypothetical protein